MVIANNNESKKDLNLSRFKEILTTKTQAKDIVSNQISELGQTIQIAPKTVLILELK